MSFLKKAASIMSDLPGLGTVISAGTSVVNSIADGESVGEVFKDATVAAAASVPIGGDILGGIVSSAIGDSDQNPPNPLINDPTGNRQSRGVPAEQPFGSALGSVDQAMQQGVQQAGMPTSVYMPGPPPSNVPPLYAYPSNYANPKSIMKPGLLQRSVSFGGSSCAPCGQATQNGMPPLTMQQQSEVQELGCYTKCCSKFAACQPNKPVMFAFLNDQNGFTFSATDVPSYVVEDGVNYSYESYKSAIDSKKKECASVLSGGKKRRRPHKRRPHKGSCGGSVSSMSCSTAGSKKSACSKASSVSRKKRPSKKKKRVVAPKRVVKTKQQKAREARLRAARAELRARTAELKCMSYQAQAQPAYAQMQAPPGYARPPAQQNVRYPGARW